MLDGVYIYSSISKYIMCVLKFNRMLAESVEYILRVYTVLVSLLNIHNASLNRQIMCNATTHNINRTRALYAAIIIVFVCNMFLRRWGIGNICLTTLGGKTLKENNTLGKELIEERLYKINQCSVEYCKLHFTIIIAVGTIFSVEMFMFMCRVEVCYIFSLESTSLCGACKF